MRFPMCPGFRDTLYFNDEKDESTDHAISLDKKL